MTKLRQRLKEATENLKRIEESLPQSDAKKSLPAPGWRPQRWHDSSTWDSMQQAKLLTQKSPGEAGENDLLSTPSVEPAKDAVEKE